jgi:hypothetical protein
MRRNAVVFALASAWLIAAGVVEIQAQPRSAIRKTGGGTSAGITAAAQMTQTINPALLLPDLVGEALGPGTIMEAYSDENPCVPHTHDRFKSLRVTNPTTRPASGSIQVRLLKDGAAVVGQWAIPAPGPGASSARLGLFHWVIQHDCPSGGNSMSQTPPPPSPNYRLEVDTTNAVMERDENNVLGFYVDPAVAFQPE